MHSAFGDISDETGERLLETGKKVVKNVVKGATQSVKGQIAGKSQDQSVDKSSGIQDKTQDKGNKKIDPVTGKPIVSKKMLTQLNQQVAQLAQMRMKKVREELEKQRLRTENSQESKSKTQGEGPEILVELEKPKEDVISKVLKASKSTGEFGKNIGG